MRARFDAIVTKRPINICDFRITQKLPRTVLILYVFSLLQMSDSRDSSRSNESKDSGMWEDSKTKHDISASGTSSDEGKPETKDSFINPSGIGSVDCSDISEMEMDIDSEFAENPTQNIEVIEEHSDFDMILNASCDFISDSSFEVIPDFNVNSFDGLDVSLEDISSDTFAFPEQEEEIFSDENSQHSDDRDSFCLADSEGEDGEYKRKTYCNPVQKVALCNKEDPAREDINLQIDGVVNEDERETAKNPHLMENPVKDEHLDNALNILKRNYDSSSEDYSSLISSRASCSTTRSSVTSPASSRTILD